MYSIHNSTFCIVHNFRSRLVSCETAFIKKAISPLLSFWDRLALLTELLLSFIENVTVCNDVTPAFTLTITERVQPQDLSYHFSVFSWHLTFISCFVGTWFSLSNDMLHHSLELWNIFPAFHLVGGRIYDDWCANACSRLPYPVYT